MSELNDKLLEIKRQKDEYILPENLKKDVTVYGVTGTLEPGSGGGDVKLFETEQQMQQDPDAQDGDLAIIYGSQTNNIEATTPIHYVLIPKTVVLPEAITDIWFNVEDRETYNGIYLSGDNTQVMMYVNVSTDERYNINYTSTDGITFIAELEQDLLVKFNQILYNDYPEDFDSNVGYFIKNYVPYFDAPYIYKTDSEYYAYITNIRVDNNEVLYDAGNKIPFDIMKYCGKENDRYFLCSVDEEDESGNPTIISRYQEAFYIGVKAGHIYILRGGSSSTSTTTNIIHINTVTGEETIETVNTSSITLGTNTYQYVKDVTDIKWFDPPRSGAALQILYDYNSSLIKSDYILQPKFMETKYWHGDTQLTLNNSNQLLPNVIALGSKGVITGDNTVYDNLNYNDVWVASGIIDGQNTDGLIFSNNTSPVISYNHNSSGNNKFKLSNYLTDTMGYSNLKAKIDNNTIIEPLFTADKVTINKYELSNGSIVKTELFSSSDASINPYSGGYGMYSAVAFDGTNNCMYMTSCIYNENILKIWKYDLTANVVTKLAEFTLTTNYMNVVIVPEKQAVYADVSYGNNFCKFGFDGTKITIHTHSGYSSAKSHSKKYIAAYTGSSTKLYDIENEQFTNITTATQSQFALYTINNKTYLIESSTVKVIENGVITKTTNIDFSNYPGITGISGESISSLLDFPIVYDNKVFLENGWLDLTTDTLVYDKDLYKPIFVCYADNRDVVFFSTNNKEYHIYLDIQNNGSGKYTAYKYTYKSGGETTTGHIIRDVDRNYVIAHNVLD